MRPHESRRFRRFFGSVFEYITGLAIEFAAYRFERREADRFRPARFEHGEVYRRYADARGEVARRYFPFCHHDIKVDNDIHSGLLYGEIMFFPQFARRVDHIFDDAYQQEEKARSDGHEDDGG